MKSFAVSLVKLDELMKVNILCSTSCRKTERMNLSHLGLQFLLVHISVLTHQHSVGGRLCSSLSSPLAQTHSAGQNIWMSENKTFTVPMN